MTTEAETAEITFTQYLRPNGRPVTVKIARPKSVFDKAQSILDAGYRFSCEELMNGTVSLTIGDDDGDYAFEFCANGPNVPAAVDRLIEGFDPAGKHRTDA